MADRPEGADTDRVIPEVLGYETAWERLVELAGEKLAATVWTELVGPLYDRVEFTRNWSRGQCRRCNAQHPEWWKAQYPKREWPGHRLYCPKYVGPVVHKPQSSHAGALGIGFKVLCSCGVTYTDDLWADPRPECPDKDVDWRGPRPEPEA